jgi:hypothetical protein
MVFSIAPETTITSTPPNPSASTSAVFSFTSDDDSATFECQLDGEGFGNCTSPKTFTSLSAGSHTFEVRAVESHGIPDPTPASYTWTILSCYPLTLGHTGEGDNPAASPDHSTGCATGQYVAGAIVNLSGAIPADGWRISGWTGTNANTSTSSNNIITIPASAHTALVTYSQIEYTLTVNVVGSGSVTKNPNKPTYHYGDVVALNAVPDTGWSFSAWSGGLNGVANPATITIDGNKSVTATFTELSPTCFALTLSHTGQGSNPSALPSNSTGCASGKYVEGATVNLSGGSPSIGWEINNWTGTNNNSSKNSTNTVTMPANNQTVNINYSQIEYTLAVNIIGNGTVAKNPNQSTYHYNDAVQLTASPAAGWSFTNWIGDLSGSTNPGIITINNHNIVTALFEPICYSLTLNHSGSGANPVATPANSANCATGQYIAGEAINLSSAIPASGWQISGWTGTSNDTSTASTNTVTMPASASSVSVNYTQGYTLTITSAHGTVTKTPDKAIYGAGETVQLTAQAEHGWLFENWTGDVTGTTNPASVTMNGDKSITANFVRSGANTAGVFRPTNGLLYLKNKNDTGFADMALNYGLPGDYPVVGDWDGNGTVTIGIYRNGTFYLRNSNTLGFAEIVFDFGISGDQPVAGDWDGDGIDTIGVYRPSIALFLLRNSNTIGNAEMSFYLGNPGDIGIAGDWDGDGKDTTGVFRPSNGLLYLKNKNETGLADAALNYGLPGDMPVTGDWNNDGVDTIGIYRNGTFFLRNSNTNGFAEIVFGLGNPGDMPIAGNWDGLP